MNILKELEHLNEKEELALELKREKLPLVMWGAGEVALGVNNYLKKNSIILSDVFVDDQYYSENIFFDGKRVISYSMLVEKYKVVNLILGCSNYEKITDLKKIPVFNNVFYLFSADYGVFDKISIEEVKNSINDYENVYNLLEDEKSRRCFLAFLKTRISGNNSYILDVYDEEMNFFNNSIFKVSNEEILLDVGAYNGDTISLFLRENGGRYKYIYAVEPDEENRKKLMKYMKESGLKNIMISKKGAWKEKGKLYFSQPKEENSGIIVDERMKEVGNISIDVEQLDNMFEYNDKISFLKINYFEGVKEALQGAEHILKTHGPKLAITVGFDCRNIRYIPNIIKNLNPKYKIYLRYNRGMISSLTCYGII